MVSLFIHKVTMYYSLQVDYETTKHESTTHNRSRILCTSGLHTLLTHVTRSYDPTTHLTINISIRFVRYTVLFHSIATSSHPRLRSSIEARTSSGDVMNNTAYTSLRQCLNYDIIPHRKILTRRSRSLVTSTSRSRLILNNHQQPVS
jgi:hypothetical protein